MNQEIVCVSETLKTPEYSYSAPISEFVPTSKLTSKPKKSRFKLDRIISYLCRNPEIKPALRAFLCRDLLTQDTNEAVRRLGSDMEELHRQNPRDAVITKVVAEVWAVANGMRLVPDAKITASIKQQRKTGFQKFLRYMLFGNQDTILIEENVNLAADNEALKLENRSLENRQKEAETKAAEIIKQAVNSAKEITGSAVQRAAEAEKETELRRNILQTKADSLQKECARLEEMKNELLKNPDLKTVYEKSSDEQFQKLQEKTVVFAEALNRFEKVEYHSMGSTLIELTNYFSEIRLFLEFIRSVEINFDQDIANKLLLNFLGKLSHDINITVDAFNQNIRFAKYFHLSLALRRILSKNTSERIKEKIESLDKIISDLNQLNPESVETYEIGLKIRKITLRTF